MKYKCSKCNTPLKLGVNLNPTRVREYPHGGIPCLICLPPLPPKPRTRNERQSRVLRGELLSKRRIEELKAKCRSGIRFNQKLKKKITREREIYEEKVARQKIYMKKRKRIELNKL